MKRVCLLVVAASAVCLAASARVAADPVWAGRCGIRARETLWGEYGGPQLLPILARPGTMLAVTYSPHSDYPAQARARGAATYAFDLHMAWKVGTPSAPVDPSSIAAVADKEFGQAVSHTDCATPLIVENELFGAKLPTPWTASTEQYRADVLALLQDLAAHGAHPALLVNKAPFTGSSEALAWWRAVTKVADLVREVYLPATRIWPLGPVLGNRLLRDSYRDAVDELTSIGIPANRVGIMLSFLSQKGVGGRNGLEPASAWFQVVKWEALAAKEVAHERGLGSVFSWGWQEWNRAETDPAKPKAACVWLWARDRHLCNAPKELGKSFDRSLTEGQIALPAGAVCKVGKLKVRAIGGGAVGALAAVTGDRGVALSALFERRVESEWAAVPRNVVLAAEREVIAESFHGDRGAYLAALHAAHASVSVARAILADELRQARLERRRPATTPKGADVAAFYDSFPQLRVRKARVSPSPAWLGGKKEGYALADVAPQPLFSLRAGRKARVVTLDGAYTIRPLGPSQPLGALPLATARPAIVAALETFARAQAFRHWTIARQQAALSLTICRHDDLPQPAAVDLTEYLPFLR